MTKQFFSQFRGGFENTDISSLHSVPDWDHPEPRDSNVASEDNQIVVEFARYSTHLSRPKPSNNPEILLKALEAKGLSDGDSRRLESPLMLKEIQKAMFSMAKGKSPGRDGLGAEFYHAFGHLIASPLHQMLLEAQDNGVLPEELAAGRKYRLAG
jgi:hypothetical protein